MPILRIALWFAIFVHAIILKQLKTFKSVILDLKLMTTKVIMKL